MTISWRKRPKLEDLDAVLELARDKSNTSREILLATITDLFADTGQILSESERVLSEDILRRLVEDVEVTVRQALAERLSGLATAPRRLVATLAGDEIGVAMPILLRSKVLRDVDLIEVIRHKSMEHRLAVAMRESVGPEVSDTLVETGDDAVVVALLNNKSASFHQATMSRLTEESQTKPAYQEPLLGRDDLDPALAARMYWWVSAALRTHILENFDVDQTALDDAMEAAVHDVKGSDQGAAAAGNTSSAAVESLDDLLAISEVAGNRLVTLLRDGEISLFQALLGKQVGLRPTLLKRLLFEPGGEGLAIACRSVDMEPKIFSAIYRLTRAATSVGEVLERGDLIRIASLYLDITPELAREAVRNWRRDPNYLWAIKQVLDATESGDIDDAREKLRLSSA
jgi:uncharacterized protein (DUF2336 family)